MPVTYSFDGRILVMQLAGRYATADLKAAILQALDDPLCPSDVVMLFDQRAAESLNERTIGDGQDKAFFLAANAARFGHRLAMVTASDVGYGLMRLGSVYAERGGVEPAVFRDFNEARVWLLRGSQR